MPPANQQPQPAATQDDDDRYASLETARAALEKSGYSRIREGVVNTFNYNRIETWMKRGFIVWLFHSPGGEWEYAEGIVSKDDGGPQGLLDHLKQKAG